ncbi:MAG TPA: hypothetical protein VKR06_24160 [Ktedonosporobacter sp.]|nr:hypothetical protein [Ktedonosporobacter sp.]
MGVLSLHNECPPTNYAAAEAKEVCRGIIIGEEATSSLLRALSDSLLALAAMDDTVGGTVAAWKAFLDGDNDAAEKAQKARQSYEQSFAAVASTIDRIDLAIRKYRELAVYAQEAKAAGRGVDFQESLTEVAGADFTTLTNLRVEGLRTLKFRIKLLQQVQGVGRQLLNDRNYTEFFLTFMQPLRDLAIDADKLFSEVIRGALASHRTLFQVGQIVGEEIESGSLKDVVRSV